MPDENGNNAPPSLRDIAEAAYDEIENNVAAAEESEAPAEPSEPSEPSEPLAQDTRPRDSQGRWVSKEAQPKPGVAVEPLDPAPKRPVSETQAAKPDPAPAPAAKQSGAPEHWSAEDKATFAKLPQEGQAFLLKRHGEMEAEFTRKSQASAGAVQFTQTLAPIFNDPHIAATLKQTGTTPVQAIQQWARYHKMGTSQRQEDRFTALVEMTQQMGLDPARIFSALQNQQPQVPPGVDPKLLEDPVVKLVADQLAQTQNKLNALEGQIQQRERAAQAEREELGVKSARQGIDSFADEKSADGRPLRPHFDAVLPYILAMFKDNPNRDLQQTYEEACWAHPEVRKQLLAAEQHRAQSAQDIQRARVAVRGNARGVSAPAVRPNGPAGAPKGGIRDAIEQSADEIGF